MATQWRRLRYAACMIGTICMMAGPANAETDSVKSRWVALPSEAGAGARGLISVPENNFGYLPAVVLIGDCLAPKPYQKTWAHRLAGLGYVTFLIDPALRPGKPGSCRSGGASGPLVRAAIGYLEGLKPIDIERIAVVTWHFHLPDKLGPVDGKIAAAVAFYPTCAPAPQLRQAFPQLIFNTGATGRNTCISEARKANIDGGDVHLRTYPGSKRGFDDPNAGVGANLGNPDLAYDQAAHQDSIIRVETFLNLHLQVTLALPYPSKAFSPLPPQLDRDETPHITTGTGSWTHDPTEPGPNLPPVGRSVFDRVFAKTTPAGTVYDLPDTYEGVISRISAFVSKDRRGLEPVKQVLIPRGRSLQREAAGPHFNRYPRIVAAIDGEPAPGPGEQPIFLKDRLFLGYQETAQVLEVISYNEPAARFEFQVVKNFGAGLTPDIRYADRQLCTSCHQNGAPLFPREEWQETNGARDTSRVLQKVMKQYHGVRVVRSGEIPAAIDVSTDRANLLSVLQRLWRQGCGPTGDPASNVCRALAFRAMLQYRLSNENSFDRDNSFFRTGYTDRLTGRWRRMWPNGLYISNSDIPDRNPVRDASIFGLRDPLTPRVPMEVWNGFKKSDLDRMIVAMAEDLPARDIQKLDRWLASNHVETAQSTTHSTAACTFTRRLRRGLANPIDVKCQSTELAFQGALSDWRKSGLSGEITELRIAGFDIRDRQKLVQKGPAHGSERTLDVFLDSRNMRLPDGRRVAALSLRLDKARLTDQATGTARLTLQDDFKPVRDALTKMTPSDFDGKTFHAPRMLHRLFAVLGADHLRWCCDPTTPAPPLRLDATDRLKTVESLKAQDPKHIFERYCARCHRTENSMPPNFLSGSAPRVAINIDHCAPRLDYRLSMWDVPVDERTRSPMPPESALPVLGLTKTKWRNSQELATLRRYVSSLLATERGGQVDYDSLRSCLPETEQERF